MSTRSTLKFPSTLEVKCPDCGVTLSRQSDMKRHRNTQHPNGTEVKAHCPYTGCTYKADQKSNLAAHINARHSNGPRYPCPDCDKGFTDPAARTRHRKKTHNHKPYHTNHYIVRQARKAASQKKRGKALSKKADDRNTQNASAVALNKILTNATYHDNFWKLIVDVPRRNASELEDSKDVQISVPVAAEPACDAPKSLHSDSDLSLPESGQFQPSAMRTLDGTFLHGSQLATIVQPQSQALAQSWAASSHNVPAAPSGHRSFAAPFDGQSTYPGMGFQSLPAFSFTDIPSESSMPNLFTFPTTSTAPSSSRLHGHTIPAVASDRLPFTAPFPTSDRQSTYPDMGYQSLPEPVFPFANIPSSMQNLFTYPTTSTAPSSSRISGQF